nr:MAG TPA_asm: hypothetical protein [Bacteriophage sp.]
MKTRRHIIFFKKITNFLNILLIVFMGLRVIINPLSCTKVQ